jgi:hypothetical protein
VGFTLSGRRYSGWETEEDMDAIEEQVRSGLVESRGPKLSHLPVPNDKFDPTRAE